MKIALLASAASTHTHRWANFLQSQNHEVIVFSDKSPKDHMNYGDARIIHPDWSLIQKIKSFKLKNDYYANNKDKWKAYRSLILKQAPDVLHAHEAIAYGPMLAHFPEFPRVLTPWGRDMESLVLQDEERKSLCLQAVRSADMISTNAPGMERKWSEQTGIEIDRFDLFSWGIDPGIFHKTNNDIEIRNKLGINDQSRILLSPRLVDPYYRQELIIDGWNVALNSAGGISADCLLVILRAGGSDTDWESLKNHGANSKQVIFIEQNLSSSEMAALYSSSQAVVMIPKTDQLAMSLLEAIACGALPIIADHDVYHHVIGNEDSARGIFLEKIDSDSIAAAFLRWIDLSGDQLSSVSEHNCEVAKRHFDRRLCMKRIEVVYEKAIGNLRMRIQ